jgi:hypothetical protein
VFQGVKGEISSMCGIELLRQQYYVCSEENYMMKGMTLITLLDLE